MNLFRSLLSFERAEFLGKEHFFTQKINHFDPSDNRTFQQRFFVNTSFVTQNTHNLIVYIGGESELEESKITEGPVFKLANSTDSAIVALEHRFFGKSQPFNSTNAKFLKYLTVEQALEDLAVFITDQRTKYCGSQICDVLVVGGSYPGSLSSWFRLKYPHIANYSWSSSAPINVKLEFPDYEILAIESFKKVSEECYDNTKQIIDFYVDGIVNDNKTIYKILDDDYGIPSNTSKESIANILTEIVFYAIQYNTKSHLLDNFCKNNDEKGNPNFDSFLSFYKDVLKYFNLSPLSLDMYQMTDEDPYASDAALRCWTWLQCNQFGWFSTPAGFSPSILNLTYSSNICKKLFGIDLPQMKMNLIYGGIAPETSMVIYTNGDSDPWSSVGIKETRAILAQYNFVFPNATHCSDLSSDELSLPIREKLEFWMKGNTCVFGINVLDSCVCYPNYGGDRCDIATVSEERFWIVTIMTVISPFLMIITIGGATWWIFRKIQEDQYLMTLKY